MSLQEFACRGAAMSRRYAEYDLLLHGGQRPGRPGSRLPQEAQMATLTLGTEFIGAMWLQERSRGLP